MTQPTTLWFAGSVKPVRVGVYERRCFGAPALFSYWDGARWFVGHRNRGIAATFRTRVSLVQNFPWRGLAQDPAGEKTCTNT